MVLPRSLRERVIEFGFKLTAPTVLTAAMQQLLIRLIRKANLDQMDISRMALHLPALVVLLIPSNICIITRERKPLLCHFRILNIDLALGKCYIHSAC